MRAGKVDIFLNNKLISELFVQYDILFPNYD